MKRIFIITIILVLALSSTIFYLNNFLLPKKVKFLIINAIEEQTQKKVSLDSVKIKVFSGFVLKNLTIYDDKETFIRIKEVSCNILLLPVFKKRVIIPFLRVKSPLISLIRREDGSFNIQELFPKKSEVAATTPSRAGAGYEILVYWVKISDGAIRFQDKALPQPFTKNLENLHLSAHLSLPDSVKFAFKSQIPAVIPINFNAAGEFKIPKQQLNAKVFLQNLSPKEFSDYYHGLKISVPEGLINALINLKLGGSVLSADLDAQNKNLTIQNRETTYQLNSNLKASLKYSFKDQQFLFSGKTTVTDSKIIGMNFVGPIDGINGEITFNNSGISSNNLNAKIWELPIKAKASLTNFAEALLNIDIFSDTSLGDVQRILKDKLKFIFPADIKGQGNLYVNFKTKFGPGESLQIRGWLDILNGELKFKRIPLPLEGLRGRLEYENNQLKWADLNFTYQGVPYNSKCVITDFKSPGVQFMLSSDELSLDSFFSVNNKQVKLTKLDGEYLSSVFSVSGNIDIENPDSPRVDLSGSLEINLQDLRIPLKKFKDKIEKIKPEGRIHGQFKLSGGMSNFKNCNIEAKLASPELYLYGLKGEELFLNYSQEGGRADIPLMHMSLYGGTLDASASMNLNLEERPYWVSADIKGVKIEKLKLDTPAKDKDVSGNIEAQATLNGVAGDVSKLSGGGKIFITEGRLWQLNLFKGMGALLFTKDFTNIVFHEGQCSFIIKDKYISTDALTLRSNIVDLVGPVRIGFDNSINASFDVQVQDEMVPTSGTFRDVTTAIAGQAGRFGVIEIKGTLKEPKYKFRSDVGDLLDGLKKMFLH